MDPIARLMARADADRGRNLRASVGGVVQIHGLRLNKEAASILF